MCDFQVINYLQHRRARFHAKVLNTHTHLSSTYKPVDLYLALSALCLSSHFHSTIFTFSQFFSHFSRWSFPSGEGEDALLPPPALIFPPPTLLRIFPSPRDTPYSPLPPFHPLSSSSSYQPSLSISATSLS